MKDIVERLRGSEGRYPTLLEAEAADEIERLRNECSNLTEIALEAGKKIKRLRAVKGFPP